MFISFGSYASSKQPCSENTINTLVKDLQQPIFIDSSCKPLPNNKDITLASTLTEIDDEDYIWRVALLNENSQKILGLYQSDIGLDATLRVDSSDNIWIDTAAYTLTPDSRAFGVRLNIGYWPQYAQAGSDRFLTLFKGKPENGKLIPILYDLPMYIWSEPSCDEYKERNFNGFGKANGYINIIPTKSAGLNDLQVVYPIKINKFNSNDEMTEENSKKKVKVTLHYDGKKYSFNQYDNIFENFQNKIKFICKNK